MRKLLLLITLCCTLGTVAQRVTEEQALQKARNFLKDKTFSKANKARSIKGKAQGIPYRQFYIFNVEDDGGFVIVSGDERAKEILAYSDSGHLNYGELPDNLKGWLDFYEEAIKAIPARTTATRAVSRAPKAEVKPLMTFAWNQYDPYNKYCPASPEDPTQTSVTGCVATAMAQIMYYHQWPLQTTKAIPGYMALNGEDIPDIPITTIDWNNILPKYDGNYYLSSQADAVATLMKLCGVGAKAQYSETGSGTNPEQVITALSDYFNYCKAIWKMIKKLQLP